MSTEFGYRSKSSLRLRRTSAVAHTHFTYMRLGSLESCGHRLSLHIIFSGIKRRIAASKRRQLIIEISPQIRSFEKWKNEGF